MAGRSNFVWTRGPECAAPLHFGGSVTNFAPHKALKSVALGQVDFDERFVVHPVAGNSSSGWMRGHGCAARTSSTPQVFFCVLLSSLEKKLYQPELRALLGAASHFCEVVVFKSRTVPNGTTLNLGIFRVIRRGARTRGPWCAAHYRRRISFFFFFVTLEPRVGSKTIYAP